MKKIVFSLLALAATMNIFAVEEYTAYAKIKIASNSGYSINMTVAEGATENLVVMNEDAPFYIGMYAIYNSTNYQRLTLTTELGELPIGFKAAPSVASADNVGYTISLLDVKGTKTLYLKDLTNDSIIPLVASREYAFTIENAQIGTKVENRFQLVAPSVYSRDVTDGNWGTLCLPWASVAVEGAEMFTVAGKDAAEPTGVYLEEYANNLVAGQPYVFKATDSKLKVYYFPATGAAAGSANGLVGSLTEQTIAAGMYIIDDNQLKNTDGTCKVRENGAYFDFSKMSIYTPQPGAPVRFMSIRGISTDIEAAKAAGMKEGKMIMNGKFIIVKDGKMFNAQGAAL